MPNRTALVSEQRAVHNCLVAFDQSFALSLYGECVAGIFAVKKNALVRIRGVEVGRMVEAPRSSRNEDEKSDGVSSWIQISSHDPFPRNYPRFG